MDNIKKIFIGLLSLILIVFIAGFFLGKIIKTSFNSLIPEILGVEASIQRVDLSFLSNKIMIDKLAIKNPSNFDSENIFYIKHFNIDMTIPRIFKDQVLVDKIMISSPELTYEVKNGKTNFIEIKERIENHLKKEHDEKDDDDGKDDNDDDNDDNDDDDDLKVFKIKHFIIYNAKIHIIVEGIALEKKIAKIELKNVENKYLSLDEIADEIMSSLLSKIDKKIKIKEIIQDTIKGKVNLDKIKDKVNLDELKDKVNYDEIENKVKINIKEQEEKIKKEIENNILNFNPIK